MELNNYYMTAQFLKEGYAEVGRDLGVALNATAEFTLASWIRLAGTEDRMDLLSCEDYFRFGIDNEKLTLEIKGLPVVSGSSSDSRLDKLDWHYVAVTYNLQHIRLYIDGVCVTTASLSGSASGMPGVFRIGSGMEGRMRGLSIYKKNLSADEVKESMFGSVADKYLTADFDFTCNPPRDTKSPDRTIQLAGDAKILAVYPSLKLSGNAFALPYRKTEINPGGNNLDSYTVHAILRIGNLKGRQFIFANSLPQINSGMALYLEYDAEQKKMFVKSLRGSVIEDDKILMSRSGVSLGQWVSIATVYDGESLRIYIDGEKDAEAVFGPVLVSAYQGNPVIGARFLGGELTAADSLQGNISRLEVWHRALDDDEIRQYAGKLPDPDAIGLVCLLDFSVYHVKNEADGAPACMSDGAIISEYVVPAAKEAIEQKALENKVTYETDAALLQSFRQQVDFSLAGYPDVLSFSEAGLMDELGCILPEGVDTAAVAREFKKRWEEVLGGGAQRFWLTQHTEGREYFIVVHYPDQSYVAYRCGVDQIDECSLYKVRLIFTIVVGIADILLGVKPVLTDKAVAFIQRSILILPEVVTTLSAGTAITSAMLFNIGRTLVGKGLLKELFKLILTFGFWSLIRLATRLILSFLGIGAADMVISLAATVITFTILYVEFVKHCLPFPHVQLYGIKFNHDVTQHQTSALNIRTDHLTDVHIPEWTSVRQDPAAYAIRQVPAGEVRIQAKFVIDSVVPITVQIRANAVEASVLGDVGEFPCAFRLGTSVYVTLAVAFRGAAVGTAAASWNWEYYDEELQQWRAMGNSTNVIYLVMDTPQLPWTQEPRLDSRTIPSVQALRLGCGWAAGINNVAAIAPQIAQSFYNDARFNYGGMGAYSRINIRSRVVFFQLHVFLDDYVNLPDVLFVECTDCAVITAVFTRLLGGTLNIVSLMRQGNNTVDTTFIRAIGADQAWEENRFQYHVLNTTDNPPLTNASPVIDACIRVNGDGNPWPAVAPEPILSFIPGQAGHPMQYTTQPVAAVIPVPPPYAVLNSYRERFLLNNVDVKNLQKRVYTNLQFNLYET